MSQLHTTRDVGIGPLVLPGTLALPPHCKGLVVFAHGSGSSHLSPRNTHVARQLNDHGFATLLFDLLSDQEAEDRRNVFDISLLGRRVLEALHWVGRQPDLAALRIGGRPDLAGGALRDVEAPTLLIVGGRDYDVLELNREAQKQMRCPTSLVVVPGATHLFEEPGTLDQVVATASDWFAKHLTEEMDNGARSS
jgi:pimeloyl-ACP methyl ester carboxylesterase